MPWTAADAEKHTKKATTDKLRRQWATVANDARKRCIDDGGDPKDCDARAIKQANAAITEADAPVGGPDQCVCPDCGYTVDKERGVPCRSVECPKCGATLVAKEEDVSEIREAMTKKVAGHNLKSSDFLVVEDPEKTTTWHLPVKINGKADRKLSAAAWAALFSAGGHRGKKYAGPNKAEAKRKLKALYKSEGWEEPASEAEIQAQADLCEANIDELYGYVEEDAIWVPATTFADLHARREASEKAKQLYLLTEDLRMIVDNIMWSNEVSNKVGALKQVFDEYLREVEMLISEAENQPDGDVAEMAESAPVNLAEQAAALSVSETTIDDLAQFDALLSEQRVELTDPRRAPVMVDFAIIKPGHGNQKDRRYYPAEMLERDGGAFAGVDIFVTNHDPDEKTERNKVGRFRSVSGLREEGLVGTAILYDPDVAEKARNRADAGELGTLHCSILATGTGKKATVDGQEVTVIEAITQVHSVDLVSKAGAGGHAIALSESDGGTVMEGETQDQELEEGQLEEQGDQEVVVIRESEAGPQPLTAEAVAEILGKTTLDEKARHWLKDREYQDEAAVQAAVEEMRAFIAEIAPNAGEPFGLGESDKPAGAEVPKVLTPQELEERARERTRRILSEIEPSYAANL